VATQRVGMPGGCDAETQAAISIALSTKCPPQMAKALADGPWRWYTGETTDVEHPANSGATCNSRCSLKKDNLKQLARKSQSQVHMPAAARAAADVHCATFGRTALPPRFGAVRSDQSTGDFPPSAVGHVSLTHQTAPGGVLVVRPADPSDSNGGSVMWALAAESVSVKHMSHALSERGATQGPTLAE